ncbi:MAG: DMT family transporter [Deltaproteobacteria bacterium]|nr:DMT family transporter [Deltaproteobacteria bacterium]
MFGLFPVFGDAVLHKMSPLALVGFRMLLGAPILLVFAGVLTRPLPAARDLLALALLGLSGIALNQIFFAEGLLRAGPVNAAILAVIIPVSTLIISTAFRHERPRRAQVIGIVVAFLGAAVLVRAERLDFSNTETVGSLLLLCNSPFYSAYLVFSRPLIARLGALPVVAWAYIFGAIEALPFTAPAVLDVAWTSLPVWAWASLAYILVGPTIVGFWLNAYALKTVTASVVAVYVLLQPVIGSFAAWVFRDSPITVRTLLAAAVILAGVALASGIIGRRARIGFEGNRAG